MDVVTYFKKKNIQELLIFDPLQSYGVIFRVIYKPSYFKMVNDARVASACSYVRTCQRVRNSKKMQLYATSRSIIRVNSTMCIDAHVNSRCCWFKTPPTTGRNLDYFYPHNSENQQSCSQENYVWSARIYNKLCWFINNFADFSNVVRVKKNQDFVQSLVAFTISNISYCWP